MWNNILAFNSFVIIPAIFAFMVYATGRAVFFFQWKLLWISIVIFIIALLAEVVLAIMTE